MRKLLSISLLCLLLASCGRMLVKAALLTFKHPTPHYYTNGDKTIVFIPMIHLNKKEFYDEVKQLNDSLRKQGYVFVYESVAASKSLDSVTLDTYKRKFRRVVGFNLTSYTDKNNDAMKRYRVKGAISQTMSNTGLSLDTDINGDVSMDSLVRRYEKEKGEIVLYDYDRETPLNKKYNGKRLPSSEKEYLLMTVRNEALANKITALQDKKIVVLYGALHRKGMYDNLKKIDPKWNEVKAEDLRQSD